MTTLILSLLNALLPIIPTIIKAFSKNDSAADGAKLLKRLVPVARHYVEDAEKGDVTGEEKRKAVFEDLSRDLRLYDLRPSDINLLIEMALTDAKAAGAAA